VVGPTSVPSAGFFGAAKDFVSKVLSQKAQEDIKLVKAKPHYKELLNLDHILTFKEFCDAIISESDIGKWLEAIDHNIARTTETLAQYYALFNMIERGDSIKETIKYVQFLSKVSTGQTIKQAEFVVVFNKCKEAIEQAAQKGSEDIVLNGYETSIDYYTRAIRFLEQYPQNEKCIKVKSEAYYHIARILEKGGEYDRAIDSALVSIELNKDLLVNKSFELIDAICQQDNGKLNNLSAKHALNESHILAYLMKKNIELFEKKILTELSPLINLFSSRAHQEKSKLVKSIGDSIIVQQTISSILNSTEYDPTQLSKKMSTILKIIMDNGKSNPQLESKKDSMSLNEILVTIDSTTKYLKAINIKTANKYNQDIDQWKKYFDINKVNELLKSLVKSLDVTKGDIAYYTKVIEFTSLTSPVKGGGTLDKDPICIQHKANAHYKIGEIQQASKEYREATKSYVEAIELNESLEGAYRKLDEVYYLSGGLVISNQMIIEKLLTFSNQSFFNQLSTGVIKYFNDYQANRILFNKLPQDELHHLDNLRDLLKISRDIVSQPVAVDCTRFFNNISSISSILLKELKAEHQKRDCFAGEALRKQIAYIDYMNKKVANKDVTQLANKCGGFFNLPALEKVFLDHVKAINLKLDEDEVWYNAGSYYKKVIEYVEQYPNEKVCVKINAHAHLALANCRKLDEEKGSSGEVASYYKKAIALNDSLFELCKGSDNAFYAQHSQKREAASQLGDLYFKEGEYNKALEYFQLVGMHIKVKECLKELIDSDPTSCIYREQQADYFAKKGMIDGAIDSYNDALGLTNDPTIHSRISTKISNALSSNTTKAGEYSQKATSIDTTRIVYKVDEPVYNNMILNYPEILRKLAKELDMSMSAVIDKMVNYDSEFVEQVCISGNIELFGDLQ